MKNPEECSSLRQLGLEIPDRDHTYGKSTTRYWHAQSNLDNFLQNQTKSDSQGISLLFQQTVTFLCTL